EVWAETLKKVDASAASAVSAKNKVSETTLKIRTIRSPLDMCEPGQSFHGRDVSRQRGCVPTSTPPDEPVLLDELGSEARVRFGFGLITCQRYPGDRRT